MWCMVGGMLDLTRKLKFTIVDGGLYYILDKYAATYFGKKRAGFLERMNSMNRLY